MTMLPPNPTPGRTPGARAARGLTLIESTMAVALVAGLFVAVAQLVGAVGSVRAAAADRATAQLLAAMMIAEISDLPVGSGAVGAPGNETVDRTGRASVIAYNGLVESAVASREGAAIPGFAGWSRLVRVSWVDPASPSTASASDSGAAAVTVEVRRGGRLLHTATVYRTRAWDAARAPDWGSRP